MPYRAPPQLLVTALLALLWLPIGPGLTAAQETLEIYLIDVEGGGASLFVSPEGETLLIDTGNGGEAAARDAAPEVSRQEKRLPLALPGRLSPASAKRGIERPRCG